MSGKAYGIILTFPIFGVEIMRFLNIEGGCIMADIAMLLFLFVVLIGIFFALGPPQGNRTKLHQ